MNHDGEFRPVIPRVRTLEAHRVLPAFLVVLGLTIAVGVVDLSLVRIAGRHRTETGERLYARGEDAMRRGNTAEALELFRSAHNHNPENLGFHLAFAQALRANGLEREGQAAIESLLARMPAHGAANAEMARILARVGDWERAAWYYHRALYGEWERSPDLSALRFELSDLLAAHGAREQLLAEVVLLETLGGESIDRRHLARLQLAAGNWSRAERQFRLLLNSEPANGELLAGLARAQLGAGRYLAAERTFRRAITAKNPPGGLQQELELTERVNNLDPSVRRLPASERHRRAHELASVLLTALQACSPQHSLIASGQIALDRHKRVRDPGAAVDDDMQLFDELWTARDQLCTGRPVLPREVELLGAQLTK